MMRGARIVRHTQLLCSASAELTNPNRSPLPAPGRGAIRINWKMVSRGSSPSEAPGTALDLPGNTPAEALRPVAGARGLARARPSAHLGGDLGHCHVRLTPMPLFPKRGEGSHDGRGDLCRYQCPRGRGEPWRNAFNRAAFTLLELVLSLGVLTLIAAVALPPMSVLLLDRRLNRASDQIEIELSRTRLDAMRRGQVLTLSAVPGSDRLNVATFFRQTDAIESDSNRAPSALTSGAEQGSIIALDAGSGLVREITLPAETTVTAIEVLQSQRAAAVVSDFTAAGLNAGTQPTQSSLFFYPDGTTSDGWVDVAGPDGETRRIVIRGLTGAVRQFDVDASAVAAVQ